MTSLELAVRFGKTLIIQEMDGVEPVLYPLLRRDLIAQGARKIPFSYKVAAVKIMDSALQLQRDSQGSATCYCYTYSHILQLLIALYTPRCIILLPASAPWCS